MVWKEDEKWNDDQRWKSHDTSNDGERWEDDKWEDQGWKTQRWEEKEKWKEGEKWNGEESKQGWGNEEWKVEPAQSKAGRNSQTQMWTEDEDGGNLTKVSGWDPVTVNVSTDQEVPWWEDARNSSTSPEGQP